VLFPLCLRRGVAVALHHPAVTAAVIGARTAEEITVDVSYLKTPIPDALWAELTRGSQPHSPTEPG